MVAQVFPIRDVVLKKLPTPAFRTNLDDSIESSSGNPKIMKILSDTEGIEPAGIIIILHAYLSFPWRTSLR